MKTTRRSLFILLLAACLSTQLASAQSLCKLVGLASSVTTTSTKMWDINPTNGAISNMRVIDASPVRPPHAIDFSPSGVLYGVSQGTNGDIPAGGKLFTVNVTTGAPTFVANLTQWLTVEGDIAFDPTSNKLYAVTGTGALFTINTSTGVCVSIGNLPLDLPGGADYSGMAFDATGRLFVWSTFGPVIREINKSTAAVITSAPLAPHPGGSIGGLAFEPSSGVPYIAGGSGGGAKLGTVATGTGVVNPIGPLTGMDGVRAITFDSHDCATVTTDGNGCTGTTGLPTLSLSSFGLPIQLPFPSPFVVNTGNIGQNVLIHIGLVGLSNPSVPLSSLGLPPDCMLNATPDVIVGPHLLPGPNQVWTALQLPALPPSFSGFTFHCQSVTLDANGIGIGMGTRTSNGLRCKVGLH